MPCKDYSWEVAFSLPDFVGRVTSEILRAAAEKIDREMKMPCKGKKSKKKRY